jgi:hypothetical protein
MTLAHLLLALPVVLAPCGDYRNLHIAHKPEHMSERRRVTCNEYLSSAAGPCITFNQSRNISAIVSRLRLDPKVGQFAARVAIAPSSTRSVRFTETGAN